MKIHKDDFRLLPQTFHRLGRERKRVVQLRLHEGAALQIQNRDRERTFHLGPGALDFKDAAAVSGHLRRIIQRAQKTFFAGQQLHHFLLVPQMVTAGDDVHARRKNFRRGFGRDAGAAGRVLAVGDDKIERVLFTKSGQKFPDRVPAGLPYDVADEEQFHRPILAAKQARHTKETNLDRMGRRARRT